MRRKFKLISKRLWSMLNFMKVEFKIASSEDIEPLLAMMELYYEADHLQFDQNRARSALLSFFSDRTYGQIWLIVECNSFRLMGYLFMTYGFSFEYGGRVALIDELFILSHFQSKGIGSKVIKHAIQEVKKEGLRVIRLEVTKNNVNAIRLYERLGFKDLGRSLLVLGE